MKGKAKCKLLKDIRRKIAEKNDIAYETSECKYQGDCSGTCPKCEAEVRYLEEELRKRQNVGKAVAVAGIAAAMVVTSSGCMASSQIGGAPMHGSEITQTDSDKTNPTQTDPTQDSTSNATNPTDEELVDGELVELPGEVPDDSYPMDETTAGVPMPSDPYGDELMGDPTEP